MPYSAEISRGSPTLFLFLLDQSDSMKDPLPPTEGSSGSRTKAQFLADAINSLLQSLVLRCAREEGIRPYFDVCVLGYNSAPDRALGGTLGGRDIVSIADIANTPLRVEERSRKVEDGVGGMTEQRIKKPIWLDPVAANGTSMCAALSRAIAVLQGWVSSHPQCFPPSVIHISDGESTDGDPSSLMTQLTGLSTADGNCLLYNFHITANLNARQIVFPHDAASLPDQFATTLFNGSSPLLPSVRDQANRENFVVGEGARGFIVNAQPLTIIQALDIGTRPSALR